MMKKRWNGKMAKTEWRKDVILSLFFFFKEKQAYRQKTINGKNEKREKDEHQGRGNRREMKRGEDGLERRTKGKGLGQREGSRMKKRNSDDLELEEGALNAGWF